MNLTRAFSKKELYKKANPPSRYWIAPDGKEFEVFSGGHGSWLRQNPNILKQYGIDIKNIRGDLTAIYNQMYQQGWTRVSNEPAGTGFQIQVKDMWHPPSFLDDFIAKYFKEGDKIILGSNDQNYITITDPFPTLQKAVNKASRQPINANLKVKADVPGKVVNNILALVENMGGATYNLSQGNLAQTPMFAVSTHKDRERVLDQIDFDRLEGYINDNLDLLSDPKNSIGAWISGGKVFLDVVSTVPTKEEALQLAHANQQLAIFDLARMESISVGLPAFSKKELNIVKKADIYKCQDCGEDIDERDDGFCYNCRETQKHNMEIEKQIRPTVKKAEEQILTQDQQDQIAASTSPVYNIALNNFATAVKRGHDKDRALSYALDSVKNLEKLDPKKLVELANTYLKGLV